jgi:glucose-1-phosphate adenylyltransferase
VLFEGVRVGRHAKIRRAIIDKDVEIPSGTVIGYDHDADRQRLAVTDSGTVVIPKRAKLEGAD